ncbi:type II toxin-antitoxin system RelE/ParE family toxin [Thauera sp. WH-1]|uniref:type II toxin-antitoxin system RelE/ParE family toxin n=1 Tax=Thauera sp. WH-1 TaxID=3398230 RepID=UPI0039FB8CB7
MSKDAFPLRIQESERDIGEKKKGDLSELWVYTFRCLGQLYLLGYTRDDGVRLVYLEAVGPHENVYRDLKR